MTAVRRLYLSDLHLWDPAAPAFRAFQDLMCRAGSDFDEIYLLGDLCEVWVGDDDDSPLARHLVTALAGAAAGARVFVMHGNRDFLLGQRFAREAGVTLIDDPHLLDGGVLLAHGDGFCVDDADYQNTRALLRSHRWQADVLARPLADRHAMAQGMRAQSRATNANKADNIMDVSASEVARVMAQHRATVLVHGHTHRPGIHQEPWGRRYVLGAWERCGWRLEEQDGRFALLCFPLHAG